MDVLSLHRREQHLRRTRYINGPGSYNQRKLCTVKTDRRIIQVLLYTIAAAVLLCLMGCAESNTPTSKDYYTGPLQSKTAGGGKGATGKTKANLDDR